MRAAAVDGETAGVTTRVAIRQMRDTAASATRSADDRRPMNKAWRRMTPIPLTGTAAGSMTEPERERYLAATRVGRDAAGLANEVAARSARTEHVTSVTKDELGDWQP